MKKIKSCLVVIVIILAILGAFAGGGAFCIYHVFKPMGGGNPVRMDIPKGATAALVGEKLEQAGAIRSALLFRIAARLTGSGQDIKPGEYMIDPNSNVMQIMDQLKTGKGKLRLVTIPEGLTITQMAKLLEKDGVTAAQDFISAARDKSYEIDSRNKTNLEGYLLPDTYDIPASYDAKDIVKTMVTAFNDNVVPLYHKKKDALPVELSLNQAITLASLVEREAQVPGERPLIASVYYNRLKRGMFLECDATVQYALGTNKPVLKYSDLRVDSPYNTYLHKGLPPGPIANPGIESIKAVLDPVPSDVLYYVRNDVKNDGSHVFSRTFREHQAAIRKYQK